MLAHTFRRFVSDQNGATAIEYALIATIMAVAMVASFTLFGDALGNLFGGGTGGARQAIDTQIQRAS